eukprot:25042-Pelagomonas_calceolata.AAC.2
MLSRTLLQGQITMTLVLPLQKSPGVWEHYKDTTEDFATGYAYAIATGSSFIMAFYQVLLHAIICIFIFSWP